MKNRIYKKLILLIYLLIFTLTCDTRDPSNVDEEGQVDVSTIQVYGNSVINVIDLEEEISVDVNALPLDENGVFLSGVTIEFEVVDTPGYLMDPELTTDSSAVTTQFNIVPISYLS